ncbi:MrcB family domain-containing protein [Brucella anthropi]|uniref:MrcB family domain-containing protein n=1 Tax=Brucella anthropi TaxID=529 RepID=UPI00125D93D1|nr:DUF3578 domain-containing protein [Brucella anthropi]QFP63333.1 DUF3578 domain-containing protein [Brucella anthropi]
MQLLDDVYGGYQASANGLVRGNETALSLLAVKTGLPNMLQRELATTGRNEADYRCYGGYGEVNRNFAHIPWVACCRRNVARSVKDGYFIVLLFHKDMTGCWLSLNQGFTQYKEFFVENRLASRQARVGAETLAQMVTVPEGFVTGAIDLGATSHLGRGYEAGAIISRYYVANDPGLNDNHFLEDFRRLLDIYDDLTARAGNQVITLLPDAEGPYQAAAAEIARAEVNSLPDGPLPPPERTLVNNRGGWRRDPSVAAIALRAAGNLCEWDNSHETFIARRSGVNFVEAHHLIPVSCQSEYKYRLDVSENIVALCPTCHRKIHNGVSRERSEMAVELFRRREALLSERGIESTPQEIRRIYRHELEDD